MHNTGGEFGHVRSVANKGKAAPREGAASCLGAVVVEEVFGLFLHPAAGQVQRVRQSVIFGLDPVRDLGLDDARRPRVQKELLVVGRNDGHVGHGVSSPGWGLAGMARLSSDTSSLCC